MKKIKVNDNACIGCGACVAIDPEHFAFNDEGLSHAINQENLEASELQNAIASCPTSAISIEEVQKEEEQEKQEECECNCHCEASNCCGTNHEEE